MLSYAVVLAAAMALAGCAVGPDFQAPAVPQLSERFAHGQVAGTPGIDVQDPAFWRLFNDARLNDLVQRALAGNQDLRGAFARLRAAEATLDEVGLDRFPTVTMGASGTQQKLAAGQVSAGQARSSRSYDVHAQASWELDLFGRVRRQIESQQADTNASRRDLAALQLLIASQVAQTYMDMRGLQARLAVAQENESIQRDTLGLVEKRLAAGWGTSFDESRARAQFQSTQARVPNLQAQIAVQMHRLAVLTGSTPEALVAELETSQGVRLAVLPSLPGMLDPGTPADMLRRRPDVAAAESRLHAATARIGVATADLFPRLSLGALLGGWALGVQNLFGGRAATSNVVLGVDWSFLDVGRVRARISASEAGADQALADYQQTVLRALEETENALVRLDKSRDEEALLAAAADERTKAERLAQRMHGAGSVSFYEVLEAQREQLAAQDALVQSRIAGLQASVALYKALAGGWRDPQPLAANR